MPDTNYELLKSLAERWNAHDLDFVYGLLDDNYREYFNGVLAKQGPATARVVDQQLIYDTVPDYRREVDQLYADDNGGAMRWRFCGTGPNGPFEVWFASFFNIKGGKIAEGWIYGDPAQWT